MLYVVTGDIQSGKTTWTQSAVRLLESKNICCEGVLAPGMWKEVMGKPYKSGIYNVLLPNQERIVFGLKPDSSNNVEANVSCSSTKSSGWFIDPTAIDRVNSHLTKFNTPLPEKVDKRILIIDELGFLELCQHKGLTEAVSLLDNGPNYRYEHALVVVRSKDNLHEVAQKRFCDRWSGCEFINPEKITPEQWVLSL